MLNHDTTSGVTPLVIGENPNPHRTRPEASKASGSVQRAAIFDLIHQNNLLGETPGSATPLTRSSPSAKMPPGEETPSVGVPKCDVTIRHG